MEIHKQHTDRQKKDEQQEQLSLSSLAQKRQSQPAGKQAKGKNYKIGRPENVDEMQQAVNMAGLINQ